MRNARTANGQKYWLQGVTGFAGTVGRSGSWMNERCPNCNSERVLFNGVHGFCEDCGQGWLDEK